MKNNNISVMESLDYYETPEYKKMCEDYLRSFDMNKLVNAYIEMCYDSDIPVELAKKMLEDLGWLGK